MKAERTLNDLVIIAALSVFVGIIINGLGAILESVLTSDISQTLPTSVLIASIALVSVVATTGLYLRYSRSRLPVAYNVAIVGFPKSGKTTLIVSLFGEIFAQRISNIKASLNTTSTIERVNEHLKSLAKGYAVGPTTDQDMFAYRTNIQFQGPVFRQTYKVEFGDFPGEDSEKYVEQFGAWLHTTPFFRWMASADAVVFVVDLAQYINPYLGKEYAADISASIRAAWQNIVEHAEEGREGVRRRQIVLAFTKADLFGTNYDGKASEVEKTIISLGYGDKTPPVREINTETLQAGITSAKKDFADLIEYLENEVLAFSIVFFSAFATVQGVRLGASELLSAVLPGRARLR